MLLICLEWNSKGLKIHFETAKGGKDGMDIESFLVAIKIRQILKADRDNTVLQQTQRHGIKFDDITVFAGMRGSRKVSCNGLVNNKNFQIKISHYGKMCGQELTNFHFQGR